MIVDPAHFARVNRPPTGAIGFICGVKQGVDLEFTNLDVDKYNECETALKEAGYRVNNPARFTGLRRDSFLRLAIRLLTRSDFIVVMPGWQFDRGANIQLDVARALRMQVVSSETLEAVWTP